MLWDPGAMGGILLLKFFLLLALRVSQGHHLGPTSHLRYSRFLDPSHVIFLRWDFDLKAEVIVFELQVRTAGWVGVGITNRYTIVGGDLVIGGVLPNGNVYFSVSSKDEVLCWGGYFFMFIEDPYSLNIFPHAPGTPAEY